MRHRYKFSRFGLVLRWLNYKNINLSDLKIHKTEQTKEYYFLSKLEGNFLGTSWEFGGTFIERTDNTLNWKIEAYNNNQPREDSWAQACHCEQLPGHRGRLRWHVLHAPLHSAENTVSTSSLRNSSASKVTSNTHFAMKRSLPQELLSFARKCSMREIMTRGLMIISLWTFSHQREKLLIFNLPSGKNVCSSPSGKFESTEIHWISK